MRWTRTSRSTGLQAAGACLAAALFIASAIRTGMMRDTASEPCATMRVVVSPGDTLWSIAQRIDVPGTTMREKVAVIRKANGLATASLKPGQVLLVPVKDKDGRLAQRTDHAGVSSELPPTAR